MDNGNGFYTVEEITKRLSISTFAFWTQLIGQSVFEELARHGFKRIELIDSPDHFDMADADSMRKIGEISHSCGIDIVAYHAWMTNFSDLDTEAKRVERVDLCRRQIDTMLELGGTVWGSHAQEMDTDLIKSYRELAQHIQGTKAFITVENFGGELCVDARMAFLDEIDHPQVGLILDIGHERNSDGENSMCIPGEPTRIVEFCRKHLCHIHMHGFKDGADHHPPLVEGDGIQWVELFRALRAVGYSGYMNFEPSRRDNALEATANAPARIVELEAQGR